MRLLGILLSLSAAWGGEFAVFNNGSRLHIDRHEAVNGTTLRLYQGEGFTELGVSQIAAFEPDDVVPTPGGQPAAQTALPVERQASTEISSTQLTPEQLADLAADKYGLPHQLVRSVMAAESANQVKAVSPKGAIGLMQLMPATAQDLGVDPHDPAQNVDAGARYLRDLLVKYRGALWHALAAYNAGPGAVDKHNSIPPYRETIRYINRIDRALRSSGALNSSVDAQ
jgi:hypothetical protein